MSDLNDSHNQKVEIVNDCSSDADKSEGSEAVVFFQKIKKTFFMSEIFNRFLSIYLGTIIVAVLAFLAIPVYNILQNYNTLLDRQVKSLPCIDDWDKKIIEQEKRLKILTTDSVDGRLKKVELLLEAGNFNKDELKHIQKMSIELKSVKEYIRFSSDKIDKIKDFQHEFTLLEQKLENKIKETEICLIKWMFASILVPIIILILQILLQNLSFKKTPTKPAE